MEKNYKCIYDPLAELMAYYSKEKAEKTIITEKKEVSIEEALKIRIIDGDKIGIEKDLNTALKKYSALEIINNILLEGMKVVGELFGSGQMQLPFVLQSAECMKTAVGYLEPFMEKVEGETSKGIMVLATVKGDVHDIGKNLVDIILTNNGYKVINLGIKCPLENILNAYSVHNADVIGMSGLLVKSTAIMKENLELMNERGYDFPVVLGGAALNKRFVEGDLRSMYAGDVYYANDAFDGLKYMEFILEHKKKGVKPKLEIYIDPRIKDKKVNNEKPKLEIIKSNVSIDNSVLVPPFWGSKIITDIHLEKVFEYINEVALFRGSWNVYKDRTKPDKEYDELIKNEIIPVFNELKLKVKREKLLTPKVIYGYFPCQSDGNDLIIYKPKHLCAEKLYNVWENVKYETLDNETIEEWKRFNFPRQTSEKHLCISDFFKSKDSGKFDVAVFQIVTAGKRATEYAQELYNDNKYKEYLYFHGLSVETTEALAEYWHKIIRKELGIDKNDSTEIKKIFQQGYRGSRYSFGYPACPNLEDNKILFDILNPERIEVTLTEEYQMVPEQSTNAIICHHPEAKYFFIK